MTELEMQSRYEAARIIRDRMEQVTDTFTWLDLKRAMEYLYTSTANMDREREARRILWSAAEYLYRNQLGDPARVKAMDILDDVRRDYANWRDLSKAYGVQYREYPVIRRIAA